MIIGIISDSHPETEVAASAIEWLLARGADLLVHAEGIVESETLRLLRQSGKPYFAALYYNKTPIAFKTAPYNNNQAFTEFKNDFNLRGEPFCTEFAGLRLKIMHHPFYLFDEEPAAQNEAGGLNLDADLGTGTDRGEILVVNCKTTDLSANLNSNFNTASVDKILNGARSTDVNFKNIVSASANLKSGQSASPNASLGLNAGAEVNSNANLDLDSDADLASSPNVNLNSNASANLAANMGSGTNSKVSSGADRAANLTAPSLSVNLSAPNLNSNLTASLSLNASGEGKNRGSCGLDADKIPTIKIYGHTHYFAAAMDKNGALVLNPGEICGRKKRLFEFAYVVAQGGKLRVFHVCAAPEKALKWREREIKL